MKIPRPYFLLLAFASFARKVETISSAAGGIHEWPQGAEPDGGWQVRGPRPPVK